MNRRDSLWILVWVVILILAAVGIALGLRHWNAYRSIPSNTTANRFAVFPANPSSIVVTKYTDPNSDAQRKSVTYTLTGDRMQSLYKALIQDAHNVTTSNTPYTCPAYTNMVVWDYRLVIHYANHTVRTFTQTAGTGCVTVRDEQSGAYARNTTVTTGLPGMVPFEALSK
jgi:hypothetical protein